MWQVLPRLEWVSFDLICSLSCGSAWNVDSSGWLADLRVLNGTCSSQALVLQPHGMGWALSGCQLVLCG